MRCHTDEHLRVTLACDPWVRRVWAPPTTEPAPPAADPVDLHHLDYTAPLGTEPDDDLLPLCRTHHDAAHDYHQANSDTLTLRAATARYIASRGGQAIPEGEPLRAPRNHDDWQLHVAAPCPTCNAEASEPCVKVNSVGHTVKIRGVHRARKAASRRIA